MSQETRDLEYLETLIDQHGLKGVLQMVADLCSLKADHVRQNWQDTKLVAMWEGASHVISRAAHAPVVDLLVYAEGREKDVRS